MATKAKIKAEFKDLQIGFNNSGVPLGMRDDIDILARLAIDGQDQYLLSLFETLPSETELLESAGEQFLAENPTPAPVVPEAQAEAEQPKTSKK